MEPKLLEINKFLKSKGFTEKSIKTYVSILRKTFLKLGLNFKAEQIESLLAYWDISPRSYNLYRIIINFYTQKYLGYSLTFTKAKVPRSLPNYVTREEINKIIFFTPNKKHKLQLALMYTSGLRTCEVVRLKKYNFNIEHLELNIIEGKGMKDRQTVINPRLLFALKSYLEKLDDNDYLFPSGKYHISERTTQEILKHGKQKAGIQRGFTCHDLRHSFSINCLDYGVDIEELRKMLGHSSLRTTQIYLQCKRTSMKEIALKLERNITKCGL
jgi:site-specific recombinase XerD